MSASHKILSKIAVSTILKNGKTVTVSAATETTHWRRSEDIAKKVGAVLADALEDVPVPEGTTDICSRESTHKSDLDQREHITAVCSGSDNKTQIIHVPVKKT